MGVCVSAESESGKELISRVIPRTARKVTRGDWKRRPSKSDLSDDNLREQEEKKAEDVLLQEDAKIAIRRIQELQLHTGLLPQLLAIIREYTKEEVWINKKGPVVFRSHCTLAFGYELHEGMAKDCPYDVETLVRMMNVRCMYSLYGFNRMQTFDSIDSDGYQWPRLDEAYVRNVLEQMYKEGRIRNRVYYAF